MSSFLTARYTEFKIYDVYGNGRISVMVSLYIYIVLSCFNIYNLNFSLNQTFFFVVPAVLAIGAAHLNNINSFKQRNSTFIIFMVFTACGVFGFTVVEKYNTYALLVFSFSLYFVLMTVTSIAGYTQYRGLIPPVFVISFLTILVGGAGQFYVAINRSISITVAGIVSYFCLQLVPARYYQQIWFNSANVVLKRIIDQLKLIIIHQSNDIIFHGDCVIKMNNSLGFTIFSKHQKEFKKCSAKIYQFYFGAALAYNNYEKYNRNGCLSNLYNWLITAYPLFFQHQPITSEYIEQIVEHQYTAPNSDIRNLWQTLHEITLLWNTLCTSSR